MLRRKHIRFLRLYEPVHERFERFCQVRCYGEMEAGDLINESLLIAYEKLDQLQSNEAFLSFLCGISLRVLANSHRKKRPLTGASFLENRAQTATSSDLETEKLKSTRERIFWIKRDMQDSEMEKIREAAIAAGIDFNYRLLVWKGEIRKCTFWMKFSNAKGGQCTYQSELKGKFNKQIRWIEDENGKAIEVFD